MSNKYSNLNNKHYLYGHKVITSLGLFPVDYIYNNEESLIADQYTKWITLDLYRTVYRRIDCTGNFTYAVLDTQLTEKITKVTPHVLLWSMNHLAVYSEQVLYTEFFHSVYFRRFGVSAFAVWCTEMGYDPLCYIKDDVKFKCVKDIVGNSSVISKGSIVLLQGTRQAHIVECIVVTPIGYVERVNIKNLKDAIHVV